MKPVKLLFTSDWQAAVSNLDRCQLALDQLLRIVDREGVDYVVHLGDLKDAFNPVDQRVSNWLVHAAQEIKKRCQLLVLMGNHDLIAPQDGVPSILPLLAAAGADVFPEPRLRSLRDRTNLWMVPYIRDPAKQAKAFQEAAADADRYSGAKILCFHCGIDSCRQNVWTEGKGIALKDLYADSYDFCLGGHVHFPQMLDRNVGYVGSPFCVDWGEVNQSKSFTLVECNGTDEVLARRIKSAIPGWYDPGAPGFKPPKSWQGTRVRVTVPVGHDPQGEIRRARAMAVSYYPGATVDVVPDYQVMERPGEINVKGTDREVLARYLEKVPPPEGFTAEQVIEYLGQYLPRGAAFGVPPLTLLWAEGEHVLSFDKVKLNMDGCGLVQISGRNLDWGGEGDRSNGAGKSALLSLPWIALFGRTPKGQAHDAWAQRGNEETAVAKVAVRLSDDRVMRVVRTRRPASLCVWLGSTEVTMGRVEQTQALIERLTNLTWDVLTNSVYVGQREVGSVFGTDKERKELFSRLLGLDRFLDAEAKLRKRLSRLNRSAAETEMEVISTDSALTEAERVRDSIIKSLEEAPTVDPKELASLETELKSLAAEVSRLEKANAAMAPLLEANQKAFEDALFRAAEVETRMNQLRTVIEETDKVQNGTCPTCGSTVSVAALEKYIKVCKRQMDEADEELAALEKRQAENRAERKAKYLDVMQANAMALTAHRTRGAVAQRGLTILQAQQDARSRLTQTLSRQTTRVFELEARSITHGAALQFLLAHERFLEFCAATVGRDGLPAYLCAVAVPHLNAAAMKYSHVFAGGEISVEFSAAGGDIDVAVQNPHGGEGVIDQSHGEMRMAGLVTVFAFRAILVSFNLLALDEPGEGLDAANAAAFAAGLNTVAGQFGSLFLVTHNPHILGVLNPDARIEVIKHNGISRARRPRIV